MIAMLDPKTFTVLVTGASAGLGAAVARRFAAAGSRVIATARRRERLDALGRELGERCHVAALDVRERKSVDALIAGLPKAFAGVNVAIANAGLALGLEPAQKANLDDWETMVATNINGLLYTVRAVLPGMVARNEGHVVLIGSIAGSYPYPGGNVYGGTKAFVKQFALNLRSDLLGTEVRVTNVEPGMAQTEFPLVRFKGDSDKAAAGFRGVTPMSAEDVAETVFWSCSLPRHVNINRVELMPVQQAFGPLAFHRR